MKPVVNIINLAFPQLGAGRVPTIAALAGTGVQLLLAVSTSTTVTVPRIAQIVLAALFGAAGGADIHRLHDKADEVNGKVAEQGVQSAVNPAVQAAQATPAQARGLVTPILRRLSEISCPFGHGAGFSRRRLRASL